MQITGVSLTDFHSIVDTVSRDRYDGNLKVQRDAIDLHGKRAPRIRARVTVASVGFHEGLPTDKTLKGVRRSGSEFSRSAKTGKTQRIHAACWHAYRDVLTELFDRYPNAIARTAMAKYEGKDGFERNYPNTGDTNIGSMMYPMCAADACDCWEWDNY